MFVDSFNAISQWKCATLCSFFSFALPCSPFFLLHFSFSHSWKVEHSLYEKWNNEALKNTKKDGSLGSFHCCLKIILLKRMKDLSLVHSLMFYYLLICSVLRAFFISFLLFFVHAPTFFHFPPDQRSYPLVSPSLSFSALGERPENGTLNLYFSLELGSDRPAVEKVKQAKDGRKQANKWTSEYKSKNLITPIKISK